MDPQDLLGPVAQDAAELGTIRLAYDFRGSGPPLVFVHGLTFDRTSWQPIIDRLAGAYRCIAIDLPGHGDSDGPPRLLDDIAGALHCLLGELGIDRPVVAGHSMGANLAGIYAATYPVRGVVEVDQPLFVRPFAELVHSLAPGLRGDDFATAFEPFRQSIGVDRLPEPMRSDIAARQRIRQDLVVGYWDEPLRTTPEQLQARIDNALTAIQAPFLAVFGHVLDAHEKQHLRRVLPSAEVEEWPDRGHLVHLAEPNRFADRLAVFASQCFAPAPPHHPTALRATRSS
jgi:pimeloyl-ACP methyl ester carboxylesterase